LSGESRSGALFTVGTDVYGWEDVVRLAEVRDEWSGLAADVRAGRAALAELESRHEGPDDGDIADAARRFRYERDLLAADELEDWLERHGVTEAEWDDFLRREAARERLPAITGAAQSEVTEAEIWCQGICSGRLEQLGSELARLVAVSPGTAIDRLDDAFAEFSTTSVDERAVAREVEVNRLEWLRVSYEALVADDEDAALEAALCLRADGEPLAAVAERAGSPRLEETSWLEELDPALATRFLAATNDEVVGPVSVEDGFVVALITAKTPPALDDAEVRARAHEGAVARAVDRLVADRVVWQ
jgi:hypothetical protein